MEATIRKETMLKILAIFWNMIKFALLRAMSVMSIAVLVLIIGLTPLYVTLGVLNRQIISKPTK
jgi:hypothetical protein